MFVRLSLAGCSDPRLSFTNLDYQPVGFVIEMLTQIEKIRHADINLRSKTMALGWSILLSGFGDEKIDFKDLLPIPDLDVENNLTLKEGMSTPTPETLVVIKRLVERGQLHLKVVRTLLPLGFYKFK